MNYKTEKTIARLSAPISGLSFIGKWKQWYRVLRYRRFGRFHSVRYGLWLARG